MQLSYIDSIYSLWICSLCHLFALLFIRVESKASIACDTQVLFEIKVRIVSGTVYAPLRQGIEIWH